MEFGAVMDFNNTRRNNFIGHDGFVWWIGVVESRNDPLMLGRCKVRIKGLHSSNKSEVPTAHLPWAQPVYPINNSNITPSTLREGDMVFGFFMDGDAAQFPIIMSMFHGIPEDAPNPQIGFSDPRTDEQLKLAPRAVKSIEYKTDGSGATIEDNEKGVSYPNRLDEPTTSRLARNESVEATVVQSKRNSVSTAPTAKGSQWKEPETPYNAKYPYNHVTGSESGHYFELDDTPGAERTHLYHRSGTFSETHPDGSQVERIVKDKYSIVMKDDHVYIMGQCNITVQGDAQVYVQQNCDLKVDKDLNLDVGGNWDVNVDGNINMTSGGDTTVKASNIRLN